MFTSIAIALVLGTPPAVTDLVAREATLGTGIAWHFTVPAVNDSACYADSTGEVVCDLPHRYAPASDSIVYHWIVRNLPPPYLSEYEDSIWVARGDRISKFMSSWRVPWRREAHFTQHWFSRAAVWPMEPRRVESKRGNKALWIADY